MRRHPHYGCLPDSLVEMLRRRVDETPAAEAIVEVGGARMTYSQVWDAAARIAGDCGRRALRVATAWRFSWAMA
jgi:acyl-CoA synthetase (AMP-forming)/AMP-acid ligase II